MTNFEIKAKTCTLKYKNNDSQIVLDNETQYIIPIYQRPYSWSEKEIHKFIADIFTSYWGNDDEQKIIEEPMFIGTMQLSTKNKNNEQYIIDGQQRLTTFLLLLKVLKDTFPNSSETQNINFDWLKTEVNLGEQQNNLNEALQGVENELNRYLNNLKIIKNEISNRNIEDINADRFIKYILGNIYFVVIETKAGLSKTLQIFDAINTTGLDLNAGDIFKIRMYEYLTSKKGEDKTVFEEISKLYQKIDIKNAEIGYWVADIRSILSVYQTIIISKYNLPTTLYYLGVDTFFERLFDTILNVNQWEHFRNNVKNIELSIDDLSKIINIRYEWERKRKDFEDFTAEDELVIHFIHWSRYSRYWNLIFVYLFSYENSWNDMRLFMKQLNKLFFIHSVRFQKLINDVYYSFMQRVTKSILNNSKEETLKLINDKIGTKENHHNLNWALTENLTENAKRKNLICRLSAMLDEDFLTEDKEKIKAIRHNLFGQNIDIEHIQSYLDSDLKERNNILTEWGQDINSLGNLMVLEQTINRSISNSVYDYKKKQYVNSSLKIVKNQSEIYPEWNLEKCRSRKESEYRKIVDYLFS